MTINQVKNLFSEELQSLYTSAECKELFFIFCEKILNLNKIDVHLQFENSISAENQNEFLKIISILKEGKPYQQILGETYFYGNRLFVDEDVLIPRPETEELIELIESRLSHLKKEKLKILDVGTGSGCISISLAKIFPNAEVSSIDISEKALNIAQKNADFHKVKVNFIQKDYLTGKLDEIYDVIVSNPPYIDVFEGEEISHSVKGVEPNIELAVQLFEEVAALGNPIAAYAANTLSAIYTNGYGNITKDENKAMMYNAQALQANVPGAEIQFLNLIFHHNPNSNL